MFINIRRDLPNIREHNESFVQIFILLVPNIDRSFIVFSYVQCIHQHWGIDNTSITHYCDTTRGTYIPPAIGIYTVSHLTNQHCGATRETYSPY